MRFVFLSMLALLLGGDLLTACSSPPAIPGAVRIRWTTDPETLDPLLASNQQAIEVMNLLHCSLLAADPQTRKLVPWLAETLPVIDRRNNVTRLTYTLRPEACWDNGQPVLARDVAYTLKVMNCPGLPTEFSRTQYGFVQAIELDSINSRRFTLVCASSSAEMLISSGDYAILPEYSLDPQGTLRTVPLALLKNSPLAAEQKFPALKAFARRYLQARHDRQPGCGPYSVTDWALNRFLRLARKPDWWGSKLRNAPAWLQANPRRLDYRIIPDNATALLALRRGDIDLYPMPPARDYHQLRQSRDTMQLAFRAADSYSMLTVGFNTEKPVLQAAATRRALSLLFDVEGIIQATQPDLAYRSVSLINPQDKGAYNSDLSLLPYSPALALQQLRAAGWQVHADRTLWRRGRQLATSITYLSSSPEQETIALQFHAAAKKLGIPVRLRPTESHLLQQQLAAGAMDMYIRPLSGSPFGYNFQPILHSSGISAYNYSRFRNPENDQLITAITVETNEKRRAQLLRRFQVVLRQESPLVVLFFTRHRLIASRGLLQVQATSIRPGYDVMRLKQDSLVPVYQ